jgi:predicted adenylyl cyclase CyaB
VTPLETELIEVEHKYIISEQMDVTLMQTRLKELCPARHFSTAVRDIYFLCSETGTKILRHRYDSKLQQLTLKSLNDDPEVRTEINLHLATEQDQQRSVEALVSQLRYKQVGTIQKQVEVFEFDDCEVVIYTASHGAKKVRCVEVEAKNFATIAQAKATLSEYAQRIELGAQKRSTKTLFELLL